MISLSSLRHRFQNRLCSLLIVLAVAVTPLAAQAGLHYLKHGKPDAATFLPPPPLAGSAEQAADLDEVRAVHYAASADDVAVAYTEKKFTVFNFAGAVGEFFQSNNLPKTTAFFEKVQSDAIAVTDLGKDYFKRPRPYAVDPSLAPWNKPTERFGNTGKTYSTGRANGKLEKSFSYPSGHSTESMVLALVLADLLPEKRHAIIAHARLIGWHRVEIARHYPTDIYAGRVLALAIVKRFKKSKAFQKDFEAVRSELAVAQK